VARDYGIRCITPADANTPEMVERLAACAPDFLFSFYYRQMLKAPLLATVRQGGYNMHGSLLPRYRGRVPVNWASPRRAETGATLHRMLEKPDAGEIVAQQAVPILPDDTAFDVFNKVTWPPNWRSTGILPDLLAGRAQGRPQDLAAGQLFRRTQGRRRPHRLVAASAAQIHNLMRAVAPPYPGAFCGYRQGRLRVLRSLHPTEKPARSAAARPCSPMTASCMPNAATEEFCVCSR
jgi:methionyl-tRNA formyltransferase